MNKTVTDRQFFNAVRKVLWSIPPSVVTQDGSVTVVNEVHPAKTYLPMPVTDVAILTLVNEVHSRKACSLMLVTDLGSCILRKHSPQC